MFNNRADQLTKLLVKGATLQKMGLGGFTLAAFFTLVPAVSVGGALALAVLVCTAGAMLIRPAKISKAIENRPYFIFFLLALTAWTITTTFWSPFPFDDQVPKLAAIVPLGTLFVVGTTAEAKHRYLALAGAIAGAVVLIPLLAIEARWDMLLNHTAQPEQPIDQLFRNGGRGTTVLLALLWPAIGALLLAGGRLRLAGAIALACATAWLSFQFEQAANAAAFAVGLFAFAAGFLLKRIALLALTALLSVWLLAAPFVAPALRSMVDAIPGVPFSWAHRASIWDYVSQRVFERPFLGHGLEVSRSVSEHLWVQGRFSMAIPVHPHSASLQIWYETGLIGALLATATLVTGGVWLARRFGSDSIGAAAACASLASLATVASISYSLWAEWWLATLFMGAALIGALPIVSGHANSNRAS